MPVTLSLITSESIDTSYPKFPSTSKQSVTLPMMVAETMPSNLPTKHFIDHEGEEDLMSLFPHLPATHLPQAAAINANPSLSMLPPPPLANRLYSDDTDEVELIPTAPQLLHGPSLTKPSALPAGNKQKSLKEDQKYTCELIVKDSHHRYEGSHLLTGNGPTGRFVTYHFKMGPAFGGKEAEPLVMADDDGERLRGTVDPEDEGAAMGESRKTPQKYYLESDDDCSVTSEGAAYERKSQKLSSLKRPRPMSPNEVLNTTLPNKPKTRKEKTSTSKISCNLTTTVVRYMLPDVARLNSQPIQSQLVAIANTVIGVLVQAASSKAPLLSAADPTSHPSTPRGLVHRTVHSSQTSTPLTQRNSASNTAFDIAPAPSVPTSTFLDADMYVYCLMSALSKATNDEEVCGLMLLLPPSQCPAVKAVLLRCDCKMTIISTKDSSVEEESTAQQETYSFGIFQQYSTFLEAMRFDIIPHDVLFHEPSSKCVSSSTKYPQVTGATTAISHSKETETRRFLINIRQLIVASAYDAIQHHAPALAEDLIASVQRHILLVAEAGNTQISSSSQQRQFSVPSLVSLAGLFAHRRCGSQLRMTATYAINRYVIQRMHNNCTDMGGCQSSRWLIDILYGASQIYNQALMTEQEVYNIALKAVSVGARHGQPQPLQNNNPQLSPAPLVALFIVVAWLTNTSPTPKKIANTLKPLLAALGTHGLGITATVLEDQIQSIPIVRLVSDEVNSLCTSLSTMQFNSPFLCQSNSSSHVASISKGIQMVFMPGISHYYLKQLLDTISYIRRELRLPQRCISSAASKLYGQPHTPKLFSGHTTSHPNTPSDAAANRQTLNSPLRWTFLYTPSVSSKQGSPIVATHSSNVADEFLQHRAPAAMRLGPG